MAAKPMTLTSVDAQAFNRWFGRSKVIDEITGAPLVVYHGTSRSFDTFDGKAPSKHIPLPGFFFTPDPAVASQYAQSSAELEARRADAALLISRTPAANVMPVHLSILNPAVIDASDAAHGGRMPGERVIAQALRRAMKAGHDGAIIRGWADGSGPVQYVAFKPEQIKSALGNRGTFDRADPNILHQAARSDEKPESSFNDWFEGSQIVDEATGEPLVVYHGTTADFTEFDTSKLGSSTRVSDARKGFFFAANPKAASEFTWKDGEMTGSVMPVYLSMRKPLVVDHLPGEWAPGKYDDALEQAKRTGHDGLVIRGATTLGTPGDVLVVFEPSQIKSALGNRGTFDRADPNILHRSGADAPHRTQPSWPSQLSGSEVDDGLSTTISPRTLQALTRGDLASALKAIEQGSAQPVHRALAARLGPLLDGVTQVSLCSQLRTDDGGKSYGCATADGSRVWLSLEDGRIAEETVLHECVHSGVQHMLQRPLDSLTPVQRDARALLDQLWAAARQDGRVSPAMSPAAQAQLGEFVAEAMTHADLRERLQKRPWKQSTMWRCLKDGLLGMVGMPARQTMLVAAMKAIDTLMERPSTGAVPRTLDNPAFKAWSNQTKVVDECTGEPRVVYHGTNKDFDRFDPFMQGTNVRGNPTTRMGLFFTQQPGGAQRWAQRSNPNGANIMPVYLAIRKPREISAKRFAYLLKSARAQTIDRLVEESRQKGFDGLKISYEPALDRESEGQSETWWVAFEPKQIKSAIGNRGTFDPNYPSILHLAAWHGTPHRGIERFSTDKVGTGEGAQAYGWGLYFTSRQEIGEWYRKRLTQEMSSEKWFRVDGESLGTPTDVIHEIASDMTWEFPDENLCAHEATHFVEHAMSMMRERGLSRDGALTQVAQDDKLRAAVRLLYDGYVVQYEPPPEGELYEVEIPEADSMLLWDAPLNEQPPSVRKALEEAGIVVGDKYGQGFGATPMFPGAMTFSGEAIYRRIVERQFALKTDITSAARKASEKEASEFLMSLGITGIKYLDGNSRTNGEGTYNYVVFDGGDVQVVRAKYDSVQIDQQRDHEERLQRVQAPRG